MVEAIVFALVAALFIYQVTFFRKLTKKQVNWVLKTFNTDWEPTHKHEKVNSPSGEPIVLQQTINQFKE